jgi:SAM-dependent methyltransferase
MARFIIREGKHSPIRGSVLLIGRQTVFLTPERFSALMREEGMQIDSALPLSLDTSTQSGAGRGFISDACFFKAFGAATVAAIDVSDYEGAEIVHNLDLPIPAHLEGKFDFICNGSVLDNVFNPIMGLGNISRMLAPGGRVIHFEHASNAVNNAYLQFSPNWFFDYYVVNRFADCKAYIALFHDLYGSWDFYACLHEGAQKPRLFRSARFAMTAVIAERAPDSTWDRHPVQGQYRSRENWAEYSKCLQRFADSPRPIMAPSSNGLFSLSARAREYSQKITEYFRLIKLAPQTAKQSVIGALMSRLPHAVLQLGAGAISRWASFTDLILYD